MRSSSQGRSTQPTILKPATPMKKGLFIAACLFPLCLAWQSLFAQSGCDYRLELTDLGRDGWDGALLTLSVGGEERGFTVEEGAARNFPVAVQPGDALRIDFLSGASDEEVRYALYDAEGNLIFSDGPLPASGSNVFSGTAACPSCPAPSSRTIRAVDVRAFRADISWVAPSSAIQYEVEFDTAGFVRGTGRVVAGEMGEARLDNLAEQTAYDYYVYGICGPQDTSVIQGPFSFRTLWANDVGINAVLGPASECDLSSADTITVALANYGGLPQTLIPYRYSVNQVDGGVPIPFDGFYTGVLGKDSLAIIDFETTFDFSVPGEYEIKAWTELEDDSNVGNDTMVYRLTSVPTVDLFPYFTNFESWSSGWTVSPASQYPSWEYGRPDGLVITGAAGGSRAWVSNLNGPYQARETSYLLSPCLDFSSLSQDPELSFDLYLDLEEERDSLVVELTFDGGETWTRVGQAGSGLNWYNSQGGASFTGHRPWTLVSVPLSGAAGQPTARLRFTLTSDNSIEREGVGVDNIRIATPFVRDLAAIDATHLGADNECGQDDDQITMQISNRGTQAQTGFSLAYRVNGGPAVVENAGDLSVDPDETVSYTFQTPLSTSGFGALNVEAWVSLPADEFFPNDTTRFTIMTARKLPLIEDFEGGALPVGWDADNSIVVTDGHGNLSQVLAFNLSAAEPALSATTPAFGPIEATDSLSFDYRYVLRNGDGSLPKDLVAGDSLFIQVSTDCGLTYSTLHAIDAGNHTSDILLQTVSISLRDFSGETIKLRFAATHGADDYWLDIDNINVRRCPPSLALRPVVQDVSRPGQEDGVASVEPGAGDQPFRYLWNTGQTGSTLRNLVPGTYSVVVTDNLGCLDSLQLEVGLLTSTEMPALLKSLQLAPNPSRGQSRLLVLFEQTVRSRVQVISLMGQVVWESPLTQTDRLDQEINLYGLPAGLYLIRIQADDQFYTEKWVVDQ